MIALVMIILALGFGITVQLIAPRADIFVDMFEFLIGVLIFMLDVLLYPFNLLVVTYMPSLDDALLTIAEYFDYAATYLGWLFEFTGFPVLAITLIASYYFFVFSVSMGSYSFKLLLKWKEALL